MAYARPPENRKGVKNAVGSSLSAQRERPRHDVMPSYADNVRGEFTDVLLFKPTNFVGLGPVSLRRKK